MIHIKSITDSENRIIGRIHDDGTITEGTSNSIAGRIHSDGSITEGTSNSIAGRIHSDGSITEGTSNSIAGRIHSDDSITEGTSNNLAGRIVENSGNGSDAGFAFGAVIVFITVGLIFFSIFLFPKVMGEEMQSAINEEEWASLITMIIPMIAAIAGSIFANLRIKKSYIKLLGRIKKTFGYSYGMSAVSLILCIIATDSMSFEMVFAALLISVCFAMIPSLVISLIFCIISFFH